MSYTYSTFVTALSTALEISSTDPNFAAYLPTIIDDAEQRVYRELDILAANVITTGVSVPNSRYYTLPTSDGHVLVVDVVNIIDDAGTRYPVVPASKDVLDLMWPSENAPSVSAIPTMFSRVDDTRLLFGPPPGSPWTVEVTCTIRPAPLSVTNTTTFLTNYLSDVFLAAAMVSASGYMRNFGAQSDDPRMSQSWESQYQTRMLSAKSEELRKSFISQMSAPPSFPRS